LFFLPITHKEKERPETWPRPQTKQDFFPTTSLGALADSLDGSATSDSKEKRDLLFHPLVSLKFTSRRRVSR